MIAPVSLPDCNVCKEKRYLINKRVDGFLAVERCDNCSQLHLTDEDAAHVALADGIMCRIDYPCYLIGEDVSLWKEDK